MGKHRRTSDDAPLQPATGDSGATYWSVAEADWPAVRPALPAEMADLLAPPIVVGVARVVATSRMSPPAATTVRFAASTGRHRPTRAPADRA
ncbi:hypothetical protein MRQ36_06520 [Micromonospora sp. R77]|uniref:hypothetical protein n=1 Tax=Micromonospora sp. R77 TaxID=2925836 RepID=UPI001F619BA6|nr:hypothetical protein [Micromonospora sp. R77]MCI4062235.1 hypothetical protein [Micromonospora sp. R77]